MSSNINLTLVIWRQKNANSTGRFERYEMTDLSTDMSFLEMLDVLNERLVGNGQEPIAFESDCREGICGTCSMVINGEAHGPQKLTATCQLHLRSFKNGQTVYIEPFRAAAFPVVKDLVVDRSSFDRIIGAGGYVSVNTGCAPDGNALPIAKEDAEKAMDAASCIGCGACVAACPNGAAMLFTAAKVSHLASLPQGQPERYERVKRMVDAMEREMFGSCTNFGECQEACPKGISINFIAQMNRDYVQATALPGERKRGDMKPQ